MQEKTRIENLTESNIEDLIYVCSSKRLKDSIHQQGISLKRQWLREMLKKYGSCAKVAYYDGKPVAQILHYPEEADPTIISGRKDVLVLLCVYNPTSVAQKLGIGTKLLQSVIDDAKQKKTCGNRSCKFIQTEAFNTGELLPLPEFYKRNGFLPTPQGNMLYFSIESNYEPSTPIGEYEPLPEDKNKALILYSPVCQFSYQFAKNVEKLIREVVPAIPFEMINKWEKPEESIKRKNCWLIVNAKPIQTFFMETEKFKEEIKQVVS